jgi:phosphoserine aminotransferase
MPVHRVFNFSAGPAVLPVPVLEQVQRELLALPGVGMSVLEISHRSKPFDDILAAAEAGLRRLAGIPDNYKVLFLQGGASLQFAMVPMNLLATGGVADYLVTGSWSKKALAEARKIGSTSVVASTEDGGFRRIPDPGECRFTPGAAYVHMTSNNTIAGTEWKVVPETNGAPLVCDASSNILSRPIDVSKFGVLYAGAQKNFGPSGVTVVIIREDLLSRSSDDLPSMLNYRVQAEGGSRYNTPPVFGVYMVGLVVEWLLASGGLEAFGQTNDRKAAMLYEELDRTSFWKPHADESCRSTMNVTFRLPTEDLEKQFVREATAAGLDGLKGHRSVGGIRASIYNAFPEAGVTALVEFMREFERKNG